MRSADKRIVLFGEAGTALSAAACLRKHNITIVASKDEPRLASWSRFVQQRRVLPERSAAEVLRCLESLHRTGEQLLLFPCTDAWIETLAADLPGILKYGWMLPATARDLALTLDKAAFEQEVLRIGLPLPFTFAERVPSNWEPPDFPFVLKPSSTYRLE